MSYVCLNGSPEDVALAIDYHDSNGKYLGKQLRYWCESCGYAHDIGVTINGVRYGQGASWEWNGRVDAGIVLSPSQLMRSYRYPALGSEQDKTEFNALPKSFDTLTSSRFRHVCHTFIGSNGAPPGHIIWLGDCFMDGKPSPYCGQVRPLLQRKDWPDKHWARLYEKMDPPDTEETYWVVGETRIKKSV